MMMTLSDTPEHRSVKRSRLNGNSNGEQHFKLRGLRTSFGTSRTNDDVHTSIPLCPLMTCIMDTPHLQRLRGLKQLGISEMTYISTTHCRFEHSLGVAHLAQLVLLEIAKKQPRLNITEKDIVCVKLAGLLHDIGHGPFSHIYDGQFRKQLSRAEKEGKWLGHKFDTIYCNDIGPAMKGWEHEDGSLMMIDGLLKFLGLEIDEENLDSPLRQIGNGINARCFGIYDFVLSQDEDQHIDGVTPLPDSLVLTSRDWIFIKECILGGPLPPKKMSLSEAKKSGNIQFLIGRPDKHKEFLYDVVSNRHSGLDVDKVDYFARDERRAFGTAGQIDSILAIENAHVAWGRCPSPLKCFRCKHLRNRKMKLSIDSEKEFHHMMICYPEKMVPSAMSFFKTRFNNHQKLYTHPNTVAAGYMICDVLLLADAYIRLPTQCESDEAEDINTPQDDNVITSLPISRANMHSESYLRLKDSILDIIDATSCKGLKPARKLLSRFRARKLYKKVAEEEITNDHGWQKKLWDMDELEICRKIVGCVKSLEDPALKLTEDDIIIEKRKIHHGMGAENPVSRMRFLPKSQLSKLREAPENLPIAGEVCEEEYKCDIPREFLKKTLRVYCRSRSEDKCDFLTTCFYQLIEYMKKTTVNGGFDDASEVLNNDSTINILSQSPARASNDAFGFSNHSYACDRGDDHKRKRRPRGSFKDMLDKHLNSP